MQALASLRLLAVAMIVRACLAALLLLAREGARSEPPGNRGTWIAWTADTTLVWWLLLAMATEATIHVALVAWARRRVRPR